LGRWIRWRQGGRDKGAPGASEGVDRIYHGRDECGVAWFSFLFSSDLKTLEIYLFTLKENKNTILLYLSKKIFSV
jgi:hypothetical protein